jgi:uncharacterized protein (DUF1800 family)
MYPAAEPFIGYHEIARKDSLLAWLIERINKSNFSIQEMMCLFWQNHFACKPTLDSRASFQYFEKIQNYATGNYKNFLKEITINPCMLMFLNGAQNTSISPNENFAREILELYTVGKGPLIGVGDYTHYTEQDVMEGAKIFTGWTVGGFLSDSSMPFSSFNSSLHDNSTKVLSYHFNNQTVSNAEELEYSNYIDLIFNHQELPKFICRKIYRWFVNAEITSDVEDNVIAELANTFVNSNFEILPVLSELLKSEHFFDLVFRGSIIKSPLDLIFSTFNSSLFDPELIGISNVNLNYRLYLNISGTSNLMGQDYSSPPNVAGWMTYYQAPNFYKLWINSSYLKLRFDFTDFVTIYDGYDVEGQKYKLRLLPFLNSLSLPSDPNVVVDDFVLLFAPKGLNNDLKLTIKNILTGGLPDFEWTLEYNTYLFDPNNVINSDLVADKFAQVLSFIFHLPEFQTK